MRKGEKRKQELLEIAYRLFTTRGYENTSVDDIIEKAGIAKGTYYYYFESKEQTLEEVIGMMIETETVTAKQILASPISVPQKIAAIISSFRPAPEEHSIEGALMQAENTLMHDKTKEKLYAAAVPLLTEVVKEGIKEGIFSCNNIPERVRMLLVVSGDIFDEGRFTKRDIDVFIDMTEKLLGAEAGTMDFVRGLIRKQKKR